MASKKMATHQKYVDCPAAGCDVHDKPAELALHLRGGKSHSASTVKELKEHELASCQLVRCDTCGEIYTQLRVGTHAAKHRKSTSVPSASAKVSGKGKAAQAPSKSTGVKNAMDVPTTGQVVESPAERATGTSPMGSPPSMMRRKPSSVASLDASSEASSPDPDGESAPLQPTSLEFDREEGWEPVRGRKKKSVPRALSKSKVGASNKASTAKPATPKLAVSAPPARGRSVLKSKAPAAKPGPPHPAGLAPLPRGRSVSKSKASTVKSGTPHPAEPAPPPQRKPVPLTDTVGKKAQGKPKGKKTPMGSNSAAPNAQEPPIEALADIAPLPVAGMTPELSPVTKISKFLEETTKCKTAKAWMDQLESIATDFVGATDDESKNEKVALFLLHGRRHPKFKDPGIRAVNEEGVVISPNQDEISRMRRAIRLFNEGDLRRGMQALDRSPLAEDTEETMDLLQAVHPSEESEATAATAAMPSAAELASARAEVPLFTASDVLKYLAGRKKGSAGGLSGWDFDRLKLVYKSEPIAAGITAMVNFICLGEPVGFTRDLLCASRLIALRKDTGGVRPIAMGEALYRVATGLIAQRAGEQVCEAVDISQFGAPGRKGGAEAMVLAASALLRKKQDSVAICVDVRNAFNTPHRRDIMRGARKVPMLLPITWMSYGSPSILFFGKTRHILSQTGTKQGDPLSPILYIMVQQPAIKVILDEETGVVMLSYFDDTVIIGPPELAWKAFRSLSKELAKIGLEVRNDKCHVFSFSAVSKAWFVGKGIRIDENGFELLGCPVGTPEFIKEFLAVKLGDLSRQVFGTVKDLLGAVDEKGKIASVQSLFQVLRMCSVSRVNHLLRAVPPDLTCDWALEIDEAMKEVASKLFNLGEVADLPEVSVALLQTPAGLGGLGLPHYKTSRKAAHLGAWLLVGPTVSEVLDRFDMDAKTVIGDEPRQLFNQMKSSSESLAEIGNFEAVLVRPVDKDGRPGARSQFQRRIYRDLKGKEVNKLRAKMPNDTHSLTLLSSAAALKASGWLTSLPYAPYLRIPNDSMTAAVKARLLLPLKSKPGVACPFCSKSLTGDKVVDHAYNCEKLGRGHRHFLVTEAIIDGLKAHHIETNGYDRNAKSQVAKEPLVKSFFEHRTGAPGKAIAENRGDFTIKAWPGSTVARFLVDVTVCHPVSSTFTTALKRAKGGLKGGTAASASEKAKMAKYNNLYFVDTNVFYPVGVESAGAWGESATKLIGALAHGYFGADKIAKGKFMYDIAARVSVALQAFNGRRIKTLTTALVEHNLLA